MNLQQLRYLCAIVDHGLNVSDAAEALFTSQPGISKQVRQLEDELGVQVFVRHGKRLAALTPAGHAVVATARRALREIENLRRVGAEYKSEDTGTLAIATTHTQARYVLPPVIRDFATRYPKVRVILHQGNPLQVAQHTASGEADVGIATEAVASFPELVTLPCYEWNRCVLVPRGHPLAKVTPLTLAALARHPIITYDFSFTGRSKINDAFDAEGLVPNVVLTALDADVIKTYVELGMGVGLIAQMAYDPVRDVALERLDAAHLFAPSTTRLALRRDVFLRGYVYDFIVRFAPALDRARSTPRSPADHRRRRSDHGRPAHDCACLGTRQGAMTATVRTWSLAALIAALSMLGPFSVDMYLPAFPAIASEFNASTIALQQTLSAYLFAFAFMMLWHGALSDALGRRPVILGSLVIYALATLGCAIAGNIESMWLFRALQGTSAGTGVVVGRAIVRDRFEGAEAQRLMSQVTLVFGIAPAVAPVLGGLLLGAFGWRSLFWVLFLLVLGLLYWSGGSLPETLPKHARHTLHPSVQWRNYQSVLSRIDFLILALIPSLTFCAFFVYIASAPVFLIDLLGVSSLGFAWLFVPMIVGIMAGASISGRLAGHWSPKHTIRLGFTIMFVGVADNLATCWLATPGVPWNVIPVMIFTLGSSLAQPSLTLLLLDLFPASRGLASSLQGFIQFTLSGVVAGTIAPFASRSVAMLALGMASFTLLSFALWLVYQHRARAHLKGLHP